MNRVERDSVLKAIRKSRILCVDQDGRVYDPNSFDVIGREDRSYRLQTVSGIFAWNPDQVLRYREKQFSDAQALVAQVRTGLATLVIEETDSLTSLAKALLLAEQKSAMARSIDRIYEKSN